MKSMAIMVALLLVAARAWSSGGEPDVTALLVGFWLCESGCWDEEVEFAIEDGELVYNSWLHARPSASDGRWSLDGDRLRIACCTGLEFEYDVISVTGTDLHLRDVTSGEETLMKRFVEDAPAGDTP